MDFESIITFCIRCYIYAYGLKINENVHRMFIAYWVVVCYLLVLNLQKLLFSPQSPKHFYDLLSLSESQRFTPLHTIWWSGIAELESHGLLKDKLHEKHLTQIKILDHYQWLRFSTKAFSQNRNRSRLLWKSK